MLGLTEEQEDLMSVQTTDQDVPDVVSYSAKKVTRMKLLLFPTHDILTGPHFLVGTRFRPHPPPRNRHRTEPRGHSSPKTALARTRALTTLLDRPLRVPKSTGSWH